MSGPRRSTYEKFAPAEAFIHLDDFGGSPEKLAQYLRLLDRDETKKTLDQINAGYYEQPLTEDEAVCSLCDLARKSVDSFTLRKKTILESMWSPQDCKNR